MRILLDTNIVLDFLLEREPFLHDADRVFQAIENNQLVGYISATTVTNIFYIARKQTRSVEQAREIVAETLTAAVICPVDRAVLEAAFALGLTDFEDAVQIACAINQGLDAIVTRDQQGFRNSPIPALTVADLFQS